MKYSVCLRKGGKLAYFNYDLAKEMGLIAGNHPSRMNQKLSQTVVNTFGIQIINEYDVMNHTPIPKRTMKPNTYMATRYPAIPAPGQNRTHLWRWSKHMERTDFLSGDDMGCVKLWDRGHVPEPGHGH